MCACVAAECAAFKLFVPWSLRYAHDVMFSTVYIVFYRQQQKTLNSFQNNRVINGQLMTNVAATIRHLIKKLNQSVDVENLLRHQRAVYKCWVQAPVVIVTPSRRKEKCTAELRNLQHGKHITKVFENALKIYCFRLQKALM